MSDREVNRRVRGEREKRGSLMGDKTGRRVGREMQT